MNDESTGAIRGIIAAARRALEARDAHVLWNALWDALKLLHEHEHSLLQLRAENRRQGAELQSVRAERDQLLHQLAYELRTDGDARDPRTPVLN